MEEKKEEIPTKTQEDNKRKYSRKIEYKFTEQRKKAFEEARKKRDENIAERKKQKHMKKQKIKQSNDEVDGNDYEEAGDEYMLQNENEEEIYIIKPVKKKYQQIVKEVKPAKTLMIDEKPQNKPVKKNNYYIDD